MSRRLRLGLLFGAVLVFLSAAHVVYRSTAMGHRISNSLWGLNLHHYSKLFTQLSSLGQRAFEEEALEALEADLAPAPRVSPPSGFHAGPVRVDVEAGADAVRYSLDGSVPTTRHPRVEGPLRIEETSVLRVKAFRAGRLPSRTVSVTYVVDREWSVPVVSLVADPVFLFDRHSGIHANPSGRGRGWERPVDLAVLDASGRRLEAEARLRIHGNVSRFAPLKSFRIYLSNDEGDLRSWFGSGAQRVSDEQSEWVLNGVANPRQLFSDRLGRRLAEGLGLPVSPALPCAVYLNGRLWGAYDLVERMNPAFADGKRQGGPFRIEHGEPLMAPPRPSKKRSEWREFYDFVVGSDLSRPEVYREVERQLDVENAIDYFAFVIYAADGDRPHANVDLFRGEASGRWWFGIWDLDGGFNYYGAYVEHDTLAFHTRGEVREDLKVFGMEDSPALVAAARFLRSLLANDGFRARFVARFEELLATTLGPEAVGRQFDRLLADYADFEPLERARFTPDQLWGEPIDYDERIREIREFIARRPAVVERQLARRFPEETRAARD